MPTTAQGALRRATFISIAVALLLGLGLRLAFAAPATRVAGDTLIYGNLAKHLLQQGVYGFSVMADGHVRPTLIRLPGYPLFLAACFKLFGIDNYRAAVLVQIAVDLCSCLLIAGLARRLFGRRAGLAALWLACLCPFTANYVAQPLTETLSIACVALALYSLERWRTTPAAMNRWVWWMGFALAYSVLLRPDQGLVAAALVPAMILIACRDGEGRWRLDRGRAGTVVLVCVLTILPLVPWAMRNERTFHVFQPLAPRFANDPGEVVPTGFQRWFRTWALDFISTDNFYWNYDGAPLAIADLPSRAFDDRPQYEKTAALLNDYNVNVSATPEFNDRFDALAQQRIQANPVRYALLPVGRLLDMWLRPRTEYMELPIAWWEWRKHPGVSLFELAYGALDLALLLLALAGVFRWRRALPATAWAGVAFVVLRCLLLLTIDNSEPRYTLECFPVVLIFAGAWFARAPKAER